MQEDQKPEFVFYLFLIISQIRERGNREFFRLISYLLDIRHRRSKRCRLGIVHRWTSTLETEHAKENGGTHEQKTLSTPAAAGTQAGRLPLPHNPAPEETSQRPDTPGVLQLRGRKLPCAGRWRHLRLSADDFVLRLLQVVPLGGLAAGQDAGSAGKALICKAPQALNRGGWYHLSFAPENGPLTVHKTRYDKHDLYSPAGKGVQFHPAPQFPF